MRGSEASISDKMQLQVRSCSLPLLQQLTASQHNQAVLSFLISFHNALWPEIKENKTGSIKASL